MNPRPPDDPDAPEPTADDGVRRLLAQARETEPMPPAVSARLDRVLDDLAASDPGDAVAGDAPVSVLARRRRRRAVALLAAAVAVVAVGLTANALRGEDGGSDAGSAASDSSGARTDPADPSSRSDAGSSTEPSTEPSTGSDGSGGSQDRQEDREGQGLASGQPSQAAPGDGDSGARVLAQLVRPTAFVRDVRRLRAVPGTRVGSADQVVGERDLGAGPGFVCSPPTAYGTGRLVPVRYRGGAAVLAYRVPSEQSQTVDLLQCGTAQVLRSTTVPRR